MRLTTHPTSDVLPEIFTTKVMHSREYVWHNAFSYDVLFLRLPMASLLNAKRGFLRGVNRFAILSVFDRDHGTRETGKLQAWINGILGQGDLNDRVVDVKLMTLPRVMGYAFKPVSFWFCFDAEKDLIAVIAEVNNTFGETHSYICQNADGSPLSGQDVIEAEKVFHVSPFIERDGTYKFRFSYGEKLVGIRIDHYAPDGSLRLKTRVTAKALPGSKTQIGATVQGLRSLVVFPLIVWQAAKLWWKKIAYIPKPEQVEERVTQAVSKKVD